MIKCILKFLSNQTSKHLDKVTHALACFGLVFAGAHVAMNKVEATSERGLVIGVSVAILWGVGKEFYDLYVKKSKFSMGDIFADLAGIIVAYLLY